MNILIVIKKKTMTKKTAWQEDNARTGKEKTNDEGSGYRLRSHYKIFACPSKREGRIERKNIYQEKDFTVLLAKHKKNICCSRDPS